MSQQLDLSDSLYDALQEAAEASGSTPAEWIAAQLRPNDKPPVVDGAKTLADVFRGRLGRIRSGGKETLSEDCGEKFADGLEQKKSEGRL